MTNGAGSTSPQEEPTVSSSDGRSRVVIERVTPRVAGGGFPIKRVVGDAVLVEAVAFADGHDAVRCVLLHRREDDADLDRSAHGGAGQRSLAGRVHGRGGRPLPLHRPGLGGPLRDVVARPGEAPRRGPGCRHGPARGRRPGGGCRRARGRARRRAPPGACGGDPRRGGAGRHGGPLARAGGAHAAPRGAPLRCAARAGAGRGGRPRARPVRRVVRAVPPLRDDRARAPWHLP